jgi:hypothetical protein
MLAFGFLRNSSLSVYKEENMAEYYPSSAGSDEIPQTSTLALVSLISGIISWFLIPVIGPIVAIITGHMAKREIRESAGRLTGDGLATAGLVLGYLQIALLACAICGAIVAIAFFSVGSTGVQF